MASKNKKKKDAASVSEKKTALHAWVSECARFNNVPRMTDIMTYVQETLGGGLNRREVREVLLIHPLFKMNLRQQRAAGRSRLYRPVLVSNLGHWHADIGYFAVNKRYATPVTYRAGFLVAKDVLSRYVYATPLLKSKSAESMIQAFEVLLAVHDAKHPEVPVKSVAFDRETSVLSGKVQRFLKERNIAFHSFEMSSSKAKFAEGAIRLIREKMAVLLRRNNPKDRWWNLLPLVVEDLNEQPIVVDGKKIGQYRPRDVNKTTVRDFVRQLHKKVPAYYYGQFDLAPGLVDFRYEVGTLVRAKLIVTSSEVVGNKRSETNLTSRIFVIEEKVPYVTRNMRVGRAYKCRDVDRPEKVEVFQEDEIVKTSRDGDVEEEIVVDRSEALEEEEYGQEPGKRRSRGLGPSLV